MKQINFRLLRANEIEVRPGITRQKGTAELLLYQNSRCAMQILDETFGMDWASDYKVLNGVTYCGIAYFNPDTKSYLWRWDCGSPTEIEVEKGTASDPFKRAAVKVGIARELYTAPRIRIKCPDEYYFNDKLTMGFTVTEIGYNDARQITDLVIEDNKGNIVFNFHNGKKMPVETIDTTEVLKVVCGEMKQEGGNVKELLKFYHYYLEKIKTWDNVNEKLIRRLWEKWNSK